MQVNIGQSAVVEAMRAAKNAAWAAWFAHAKKPIRERTGDYEIRDAKLWDEYQQAAVVLQGEIEARAAAMGRNAVTGAEVCA